MTRHEKNTLLLLLALLALGFLLFFIQFRNPAPPPPPVAESTGTVKVASASSSSSKASSSTGASSSAHPSLLTSAKPTAPAKVTVPTSSTGVPAPPKLTLHKELIPKDITIVRCYYSQEIVSPGTTFGFDINGSGFTSEFQKMIRVEAGVPGIDVRNLKLVTANQIHGDMVVQPEAKTAFVYPRVLIQSLPVFSAPEPFAVVRKGDVLTVLFISMEDTGRAGRFRVITNLDDEQAKQFRVEPSTAGLEISDLQPRLPYAMEGTLRIGQRVPPGDYGLTLWLGDKEIYRRQGMIKIVRPNVGDTGFVQNVMAAEPYHRPGDVVQLYIQGSGMTPQIVNALQGKVDEFDMGPGSFTYISGSQMRVSFHIPSAATVGSYGVTVSGPSGILVNKKDLFKIVPPDWVAGVRVEPPMFPGGHGSLRILGRDLSQDFVNTLNVETDEPGIHIQPPHLVDPSTALAPIDVSTGVAPGDYWLHVSARGQKITPPYGSIIKVFSH